MVSVKNVLLTGAAGFLGSFVLRELINEGFSPTVIIRSKTNIWRIQDLIPHCTVLKSDNWTLEANKIFENQNIDAIIHTATCYGKRESFTEVLTTNLLLPIKLLEEGIKNGVKIFINTDSFFAKKEFKQHYLKDYTLSKRMLEKTLIHLAGKVKIANLRLEHVYGENDEVGKFFPEMIRKLLQNEPELLLTEGLQRRDFIYAKDVSMAYISLLANIEKLDHYEEFEVGTGRSITLKQFVEKIAHESNTNTKLRFGALQMRQDEIMDSHANQTSLESLGWKVQNNIEENIKYIINQERKRFGL
jgi:nucleoside-diphosphate-sugar epimerase